MFYPLNYRGNDRTYSLARSGSDRQVGLVVQNLSAASERIGENPSDERREAPTLC